MIPNAATLVLGRVLRQMYFAYRGAVRATAFDVSHDGRESAWVRFADGFREVLEWTDLTLAASLRFRGIGQATRIEPPEVATLEHAEAANEWLRIHRAITSPLAVWRAEQVTSAAREYVERRAKAFRGDLDAFPLGMLNRQKRDAAGEIANVSEQVQLSNPEIGSQFPFVSYFSRDDWRVRPSHMAMHGFVAARDWSGWPIIRPRAGFNCRCYLRFWSRFESLDRGYLALDGTPRFRVRWPNTAAQTNYASGKFPDAGWHGPKFWAGLTELPDIRAA